jgi:peptide/nickel transport system substrate-binding protein
LFRAYFKKWKKTILLSTVLGVGVFFVVITLLNFYIRPHLEKKVQKVGQSGVYAVDELPDSILYDISYGLTRTNVKGEIKPAAADSWEVKDGGKVYVFHLKKDLEFHDGEKLTTKTLNLDFKDVRRKTIDSHTVEYDLKEPYAPFLSAVAKPVFAKNSSGLGEYKLSKVDINGGFVRSVNLINTKDRRKRKHVYFYPTQDSLKLAFIMGEVDEIQGIDSVKFLKTDFSKWKNVSVSQGVDKTNLVTLFYNTQDPILSDKKIRQALNYALPQKFELGKKAYSPIDPSSPYYYPAAETQPAGADLAKTVLQTPGLTIDSPIVISTTVEYEPTAKAIQKAWKAVGIPSKIQIVPGVPSTFQVLLYKFKVPQDPDQYTLWHSKGTNNITKYKNLRIDKLLEDGRSTLDRDERITLYSDFQKYLLDDVPASFLYYPYTYTIKRD